MKLLRMSLNLDLVYSEYVENQRVCSFFFLGGGGTQFVWLTVTSFFTELTAEKKNVVTSYGTKPWPTQGTSQ
jgi:hypothetical protein